MKKYLIYALLFLLTLIGGICYGIVIYKFEIFPYRYIKTIYQYLTPDVERSDSRWSIGIYEGPSPFKQTESEGIKNPVITAGDVDDIEAGYVADPFILIKNDKYYMFFEVWNSETNQGDIGYAESEDGKEWDYKKIIINEKFHLSYPYIFEWDSNYYLIPESEADFSVRIYKSISFPEKWEYIGNLLSGWQYSDPSIFYYQNKWWMFVSTVESNVLYLYYSENLLTGWKPHPLNPIVKLNKDISRPGGRVINYNGTFYRFTQDCDPIYGMQVFAFEITNLSEISYEERIVSQEPIITKTNRGWNAAGMHHIDLHKVGNKWISAVDGRSK